MAPQDHARNGTPSFVERIWPVIDVHTRIRRLLESDPGGGGGVIRLPRRTAIA
jgi:hypothetical protein